MSLPRQGTYRYWKDGVLQPILEPWSLQPTAAGLTLRSERWVADRLVLAVEADLHDGRCARFEVNFHRAPLAGPLTASYQIQGDRLYWRRTDTGTPGSIAEGDMPFGGRHHLFPLVRAATGMLIEQLARCPGTVIVPWLRDPQQAEHLLLPLESRRTAMRVESEDGSGPCYRYCGGEYVDDGADCWLDETGLLQRYRWSTADGQWDVQLDSSPPSPLGEGRVAGPVT